MKCLLLCFLPLLSHISFSPFFLPTLLFTLSCCSTAASHLRLASCVTSWPLCRISTAACRPYMPAPPPSVCSPCWPRHRLISSSTSVGSLWCATVPSWAHTTHGPRQPHRTDTVVVYWPIAGRPHTAGPSQRRVSHHVTGSERHWQWAAAAALVTMQHHSHVHVQAQVMHRHGACQATGQQAASKGGGGGNMAWWCGGDLCWRRGQ